MAITGSTVFTYVVITCNCRKLTVSNITPCTSIDPITLAAGTESISMNSTDASKVIQRGIMRNRVRDGDAEVYYLDTGNNDTLIAYDDLPSHLAPFIHTRHSIHPNEGWRVLSDLVLNSDIDEDSDTKRVDFKIQAGFIPQRHLPANGSLDISPGLPNGFRILEAGDNWSFRIVFPGAPEIGEDNYGDSVEVLAFLHALESIRTNGNAIDTAPTTVNLTNVNVRTYRLEQSSGSFVSFTITQIAHGVGVLRFSATWVTTSASPDFDAIQSWLNDAEFAIPVTFAAEKPPQGSPELPHRASMFAFDEDAETGFDLIEDHVRFRGDAPAPFGPLEIIIGQGGSLPFDDLLGNPIKAVPKVYGLNAIHFGPGATADGQGRLPDPRDWPIVPGGDRVLELHNLDDTYSVEWLVPGSGNDNVITLLPGEDAVELRFTKRKSGHGRIFGKIVRRLYITGGDGSLQMDVPNYWTNGSSYRARPIPKPVGYFQGDNRRNAEAFTDGGTQTWMDGSTFNGHGINTPDAFGMNKGGILNLDMTLNLQTSGGGGVNVPSLELCKDLGGQDNVVADFEQRTLGTYQQRTWFMNWRGEVELGDVFLPFWNYQTSSTMSISSVRLLLYNLRCELEESINLELAP